MGGAVCRRGCWQMSKCSTCSTFICKASELIYSRTGEKSILHTLYPHSILYTKGYRVYIPYGLQAIRTVSRISLISLRTYGHEVYGSPLPNQPGFLRHYITSLLAFTSLRHFLTSRRVAPRSSISFLNFASSLIHLLSSFATRETIARDTISTV